MGINDSDFDRLAAGAVPTDDPELGKVSAFISSLEAAVPPENVSAFEDRHLAVVAREVRLAGASQQRDRRGTTSDRSRTRVRRALAATSAGILVAFTAGVGVAAAMGVNPLQIVPDLLTKPWTTPDAPVTTPNNTVHPTGGPANGQQNPPVTQAPTVPPASSGQPTGTHGTDGNCGNGKGAGNAECTNGNSGKDNPGKPSATKTNQGKSDGKGTSKSTATPPPTPTHTNKGKSGKDVGTP
jgi:hypothetical protein